MFVYRRVLGAVGAMLFAGYACKSDPTGPGGPVPSDIVAFVSEQPLSAVNNIGISFRDGPSGILLFAVSYGPPQDCWSGCVYDTAVGLKLGARIAWWDASGPERRSLHWFDVRSSDGALFDRGFLRRFQAANRPVYNMFANFLACDSDTPAALRAILREDAKEFGLTCRTP